MKSFSERERALFDQVDTDGDGMVDYTELLTALEGIAGVPPVTDDEFLSTFMQFDADGDGRITLQEFKAAMRRVEDVSVEE